MVRTDWVDGSRSLLITATREEEVQGCGETGEGEVVKGRRQVGDKVNKSQVIRVEWVTVTLKTYNRIFSIFGEKTPADIPLKERQLEQSQLPLEENQLPQIHPPLFAAT